MTGAIGVATHVIPPAAVKSDAIPASPAQKAAAAAVKVETEAVGEPVEWVNMCWRKAWRVYQRGLEQYFSSLLQVRWRRSPPPRSLLMPTRFLPLSFGGAQTMQPVFDMVVKDYAPSWVHRIKILEFTLDHEPFTFSNMRRRNSRKDSDLNGVVDVRYTGGAKMLVMLELGRGRRAVGASSGSIDLCPLTPPPACP